MCKGPIWQTVAVPLSSVDQIAADHSHLSVAIARGSAAICHVNVFRDERCCLGNAELFFGHANTDHESGSLLQCTGVPARWDTMFARPYMQASAVAVRAASMRPRLSLDSVLDTRQPARSRVSEDIRATAFSHYAWREPHEHI
jgi:hypothetical protein